MRPVALGHAPRGETERVHRPTEPSGEPCPPDGLVTRLHRQRPTQRLREDYRGAEISSPPVGVHALNSSAQRVGQVRSRGRHSPADGESDRAPAAESHGSHALLTRFTRGGDLVGLRQHDKEARHLRPGHEIRGPITRSIGRASAKVEPRHLRRGHGSRAGTRAVAWAGPGHEAPRQVGRHDRPGDRFRGHGRARHQDPRACCHERPSPGRSVACRWAPPARADGFRTPGGPALGEDRLNRQEVEHRGRATQGDGGDADDERPIDAAPLLRATRPHLIL